MPEVEDCFIENAGEKCKCLSSLKNQAVDQQYISISEFSPCAVNDNETLARQIFSPIHLDDDGNFTPMALSDVFNKGLSTNRLSYKSDTDTHLAGESKAQNDRLHKPDRVYLGFVKLETQQIRATAFENNGNAFGVYDTGLKNDPTHSDVCCIVPKPSKSAKIKLRLSLFKLCSDVAQPPL